MIYFFRNVSRKPSQKNLPIASGIIIMIFDHMTCYTCISKDRTFDKNSMIMYIEIVSISSTGVYFEKKQ